MTHWDTLRQNGQSWLITKCNQRVFDKLCNRGVGSGVSQSKRGLQVVTHETNLGSHRVKKGHGFS